MEVVWCGWLAGLVVKTEGIERRRMDEVGLVLLVFGYFSTVLLYLLFVLLLPPFFASCSKFSSDALQETDSGSSHGEAVRFCALFLPRPILSHSAARRFTASGWKVGKGGKWIVRAGWPQQSANG